MLIKIFGVRRVGFFFFFKNDVFFLVLLLFKELGVLGRERKAQPGKGGVRVMEEEDEEQE